MTSGNILVTFDTKKAYYTSKVFYSLIMNMKKVLRFLVALFLLCISLYYLSKSRSFQFFGGIIGNIETNESIVALTFDDWPTNNTKQILDILNKNNVRASFFLIWEEIEKEQEQALAIVQAWHQVWNHSYSHQRMLFKSLKFMETEVQKTDDLIRSLWYTWEIYFRSPYGKKLLLLPYILWQKKKWNVMFDVEPETYVSTAQDIVSYTLTNTQSGDIVLLHPMYQGSWNQSLLVLDNIISWLKERWFSFVTVDELLEKTETKPSFWF